MGFFPIFQRRRARVIFHEELMGPLGSLSHEQLVMIYEKEIADVDSNYKVGTIAELIPVNQIPEVFYYVIMVSFEIAAEYNIQPDQWIQITADFLWGKYSKDFGHDMFLRTFQSVFETALVEWQKVLARLEDYENFGFEKIQSISLKLGPNLQYKKLMCTDCQMLGACNQKKPGDCDFINAIQKTIGVATAPEIINRQKDMMMAKEVQVLMNPKVLEDEKKKRDLEGIWSYYCLNKQR